MDALMDKIAIIMAICKVCIVIMGTIFLCLGMVFLIVNAVVEFRKQR